MAAPAVLQSYAAGEWVAGSNRRVITSAITGEAMFEAGSDGLSFSQMVDYARKTGGPTLRKMTFHERAAILKALAQYLNQR
ncbi:MAG: phenylacetic acid degradation bifunctional protein PaaZ, partial [Pseudomonadota bacterium]